MSEELKSNDDAKSLDHLLDDALTGFNATPAPPAPTTTSTTTTASKKETVVSSAETAPPPSDPLQATFEAMCFDDEKFLSGLDSLPNVLSNFPFGFGEPTENDAESSNIFNLFSQLGKHADLLQKIKDEDIEKALEKLADQSGTGASATTATSASATPEEPHVEQLNMFMSSILSKDVMLPACQAVDESYEEWLTKNKESLTEGEFQRITRQHQCVKDICREYEGTSADNQQMQRVLQKFQELQSHGDPPKELLFFPGLPGFGAAGDQNLFDDAFADADKIGQNEAECSLM